MSEKARIQPPGHFHNLNEVERMRYTLARFKEYDRKRSAYVLHLEEEGRRMREKIQEYERLTERQHDEMEELMGAYENAQPLISNPEQKAYVYSLLKRIGELKERLRQYSDTANQVKQLKERVRFLKAAAKDTEQEKLKRYGEDADGL